MHHGSRRSADPATATLSEKSRTGKERKCVRLREGRMDTATVFSDDPVAMATRWVEARGEGRTAPYPVHPALY